MKCFSKSILPLLLATLFFSACKKDDVATVPAAKTPYLLSAVQNTSFGRDSMVCVYNGNTIQRMDYYYGTTNTLGGFYSYAYNSDSSVFQVEWNTLPNTQQYSWQFYYDQGKLVQVNWNTNAATYSLAQFAYYFKYAGNKLDTVFVTEDYTGTFTYDTTGIIIPTYNEDDIDKITTSNILGGAGNVFNSAMSYTHDNTANSFAKVNKSYWMLGYNFRNTETFGINDVISTLSAHNVTSETINGITKNYTYSKDPLGNIIASSGGGEFYLEYR
jgi:hypothetical protein